MMHVILSLMPKEISSSSTRGTCHKLFLWDSPHVSLEDLIKYFHKQNLWNFRMARHRIKPLCLLQGLVIEKPLTEIDDLG